MVLRVVIAEMLREGGCKDGAFIMLFTTTLNTVEFTKKELSSVTVMLFRLAFVTQLEQLADSKLISGGKISLTEFTAVVSVRNAEGCLKEKV